MYMHIRGQCYNENHHARASYPVLVASPWHHLGIDFVGPFNTLSKQESCKIPTISVFWQSNYIDDKEYYPQVFILFYNT